MGRENVLLEAESFTAVDESQVSEETREQSNNDNGVYVKGMALPFNTTSRNGVQYQKESVEQHHERLKGRPMLFNHKQDWVSGHILNTEITDKGMYFEGDINPNAEMPNGVTVAEAIQRGDINSVSIQAFIEPLGEPADEEAIVQDMETEKVAVKDFLEISAVSIPGFPQAEALPEHLKKQGVTPVTEALGVTVEQYNDDEEDEEEEQNEEQINKEQFEFNPVPSHVLYNKREDAMQRARNLGLDNVHEHEMEGQIYYMAGDNHEEWLKALDRENPTDRENTGDEGKRAEPFADYDSFEDCVNQNSDKNDPEAYCGVIKRKTEEAEKILGENQTMTDEEEQESGEQVKTEQLEEVDEDDFMGTVADMYEELDAADAASLMDEFTFTGSPAPLVAQLADLADMTPGELMEVLDQNMEEKDGMDNDGEEEEDDMEQESGEDQDTEEEQNGEETESEDVENKDREELEEQFKEQEEKINELEERLETILDNDEGKSKQEAPQGESEDSVIERRPSFKGLTK